MLDAVSTLTLQSPASRSASRVEAIVASAPPSPRSSEGFVSSSIRVDNLQNVAILEYRSEKGEVVQQYPTQSQIEAFKSAERLLIESKPAPQQQAPRAAEHQARAETAPAPVVHAPVAPAPAAADTAPAAHSVLA